LDNSLLRPVLNTCFSPSTRQFYLNGALTKLIYCIRAVHWLVHSTQKGNLKNKLTRCEPLLVNCSYICFHFDPTYSSYMFWQICISINSINCVKKNKRNRHGTAVLSVFVKQCTLGVIITQLVEEKTIMTKHVCRSRCLLHRTLILSNLTNSRRTF
jgi:hypothetical protein